MKLLIQFEESDRIQGTHAFGITTIAFKLTNVNLDYDREVKHIYSWTGLHDAVLGKLTIKLRGEVMESFAVHEKQAADIFIQKLLPAEKGDSR